jgi:hypothetical protein
MRISPTLEEERASTADAAPSDLGARCGVLHARRGLLVHRFMPQVTAPVEIELTVRTCEVIINQQLELWPSNISDREGCSSPERQCVSLHCCYYAAAARRDILSFFANQ